MAETTVGCSTPEPINPEQASSDWHRLVSCAPTSHWIPQAKSPVMEREGPPRPNLGSWWKRGAGADAGGQTRAIATPDVSLPAQPHLTWSWSWSGRPGEDVLPAGGPKKSRSSTSESASRQISSWVHGSAAIHCFQPRLFRPWRWWPLA